MKVAVIGAVGTTALTIKLLHQHSFEIVGVLGHEPKKPEKVSGLQPLSVLSKELNLPFQGFEKINDYQHIKWMKEKKPDLIFAVGFSQLLDEEWLTFPSHGCVGFHPTLLPKGRGRAPLAWLILNEDRGAASFFLMGKGADDGPIFVQEPFLISENDDAASVSKKIHLAAEKALKQWLPDLKNGIWDPIPQEESEASYYGKRSEADGLINWSLNSAEIDRLVKASTKPYPGAFTFFKKHIFKIWKCELESELNIKGAIGRVLLVNDRNHLLVQCGKGLIWLTDYYSELSQPPQVGQLLGFKVEWEMYKLWSEFKKWTNNDV